MEAEKEALLDSLSKQRNKVSDEAGSMRCLSEDSQSLSETLAVLEACLMHGLLMRSPKAGSTKPAHESLDRVASRYLVGSGRGSTKGRTFAKKLAHFFTRAKRKPAKVQSASPTSFCNGELGVSEAREHTTDGREEPQQEACPTAKLTWLRTALVGKTLPAIMAHLKRNSKRYYSKRALMSSTPGRRKLMGVIDELSSFEYKLASSPTDYAGGTVNAAAGVTASEPAQEPDQEKQNNSHITATDDHEQRIVFTDKNIMMLTEASNSGPLLGCLTLLKTASGLIISWTPTMTHEASDLPSEMSERDASSIMLQGPASPGRYKRYLKKKGIINWSYGLKVNVNDVANLHCHQRPGEGGELVLVCSDGSTQPPIIFTQSSSQMLRFLGYLESAMPSWQTMKPSILGSLKEDSKVLSRKGGIDESHRVLLPLEDYKAELVSNTFKIETNAASRAGLPGRGHRGPSNTQFQPGTEYVQTTSLKDLATVAKVLHETVRTYVVAQGFYGWLTLVRTRKRARHDQQHEAAELQRTSASASAAAAAAAPVMDPLKEAARAVLDRWDTAEEQRAAAEFVKASFPSPAGSSDAGIPLMQPRVTLESRPELQSARQLQQDYGSLPFRSGSGVISKQNGDGKLRSRGSDSKMRVLSLRQQHMPLDGAEGDVTCDPEDDSSLETFFLWWQIEWPLTVEVERDLRMFHSMVSALLAKPSAISGDHVHWTSTDVFRQARDSDGFLRLLCLAIEAVAKLAGILPQLLERPDHRAKRLLREQPNMNEAKPLDEGQVLDKSQGSPQVEDLHVNDPRSATRETQVDACCTSESPANAARPSLALYTRAPHQPVAHKGAGSRLQRLASCCYETCCSLTPPVLRLCLGQLRPVVALPLSWSYGVLEHGAWYCQEKLEAIRDSVLIVTAY